METPDERQPPDVITSDTDNATTIQPKEAPNHKQHKFRKFRAYNTGTWNGPKRENTELLRRQDDLHRYDSIASTLLLNDYQKSRGRTVFDDLDFHQFGRTIDHIIFAVCVLIANDDVEDGSRYYPHPEIDTSSPFAELAASLDLSRREQISIIEKMRGVINL